MRSIRKACTKTRDHIHPESPMPVGCRYIDRLYMFQLGKDSIVELNALLGDLVRDDCIVDPSSYSRLENLDHIKLGTNTQDLCVAAPSLITQEPFCPL